MGITSRVVRFLLKKAGLAIIPVTVSVEIGLFGDAKMPTQTYSSDACWDLYASKDCTILARAVTMLPTGIVIHIPVGYEGELKCRSSLGKKGITVHYGAIDAEYTGILNPLILNWTDQDIEVKKGDRVCQFVLRRKINIVWSPVATFESTGRGINDLGSSGR